MRVEYNLSPVALAACHLYLGSVGICTVERHSRGPCSILGRCRNIFHIAPDSPLNLYECFLCIIVDVVWMIRNTNTFSSLCIYL